MIPVTIPKEQTQYISYAMLDQMKTMCIALTPFDGQEMANLVAYLNSEDGGK